MRNLLSLAIAISVLLLGLPAGAAAQESVVLDVLQVDLWPEYDRPTMLVIYRIRLAASASLPAELSFRIPAAAQLNAVAAQDQSGVLTDVPYDQETQGDWILVSFTAASQVAQLEYYDPGLEKDGAERHFEFTWPGDYAVSQFNLVLQQPLGARQVRLEPDLGGGQPGGDGLTYFQREIGSLEAGEDFGLILDYQKDSDALTINQVQPIVPPTSQPIGPDSTGIDFSEALPAALSALAVGLIAAGAYGLWRAARGEAAPPRTEQPRREAGGRPSKGAVFCHQCGAQAEPGDRFCRNCGAKLRR